MITWLISVDISLIYHQIGVFPSQGGGGICPSTEWLGIWKQWSSTIASGNSEFGQQGSQAKLKPLSNFPLLVEMLPIHDIEVYIYNYVDIYIWISMRSPGKNKTTRWYSATAYVDRTTFWSAQHMLLSLVYTVFVLKHSVFHPARFSDQTITMGNQDM